jgi:hypothetical protein
MPHDAPAAKACPDRKDSVAYGRYLVQTASCQDCHTPRKGPELDASRAFSGGVPFPLPSGGVVRSANLTPDAETGIGSWTRERFIARFAYYRDATHAPEIPQGAFNTLMPWTMYSGMSDEDLGAIYDYLRTVKPVHLEKNERFAAN